MSLERFANEPVSYLRFSYLYDKLKAGYGTTIRFSLKDEKKYIRKAGDIIWMIHAPNLKFKAVIEKIELKKIIEIPLGLLKQDVAPIQISSHLDFLKVLQKFYDFPISLDMKIYIIYWRRIE